jgi:hypothetical protein
MKRGEVELPEALHQQVEEMAEELHLTVPELLDKAAEQMVHRHVAARPKSSGAWRFPEGRRLGAFRAPPEDWRLLSNEAAD